MYTKVVASFQNHICITMATLTKRGTSWFVQVRRNGISKSKSFPTKGQASAWATQTEAEILNGKYRSFADKTFIDAVDRYAKEVTPNKRSWKNELYRVEHAKKLPFAGDVISEITTDQIAIWRDEALKHGASSSVLRMMSFLSAVFEQAKREWKWTDKNPIREVRKPKQIPHRERIYTDVEISKILAALGHNQETHYNWQTTGDMLLFSLETAMRRAEMAGLEWKDIDFDKRVATLVLTKNGDNRRVPLSSKAIEILNSRRNHDKPFRIIINAVTHTFFHACKICGIEDAHFHDARATALTRLASKLSPLELARMVGHRDLKSLMIYYRETAEELAKKLD